MFGIILTAIFVILLYNVINRRSRKLPPGVHGFGAIPTIYRLLQQNPLTISGTLLKKYGDIACLHWSPLGTAFFLGKHELVKEAFNKPELSNRPKTVLGNHGLLRVNGYVWKEQRRFALSTLRDFGMGKNAQEESIIYECDKLMEMFKNNGAPFDPKFYLSCAVTNVICAIIFSDRFEYDDDTLQRVHEAISQNATGPRGSLIRTALARWSKGPIQKFLKNRHFVESIVKKYIREHQDTYKEGNIRDYIDAFIESMKREENEEATTFTEEQLVSSVLDLFIAGSETTGTTLRWALALMALNPEVQQKVHEEIDNVVGSDRMPNISDKMKMPFTEAVLLEIQRFGTIVPIVGHVANADMTIDGYDVSKGNTVFGDILALNRDKRIWKNADNFDVCHFYKDDGSGSGEVINRNYFIPFSVGKRSCLGEALANMETFLFFVALMQKFWFDFEEGEEPDLINVKFGIVRPPPPYLITCKER